MLQVKGQQEFVWQRAVGKVLWSFESRLRISVRALERDDEKFLLVKGFEGK